MRVTKPPGRVGGRIPRGIVVAWIWCGSVVSALTSPDAACFGARSFSDRFFPKMTMCGSLRKGVGSGDKASLSEANDYAAPLADDRNVSPDRRRACKASPAGGAARPFHGHACAYQNTGDIYGVWSESGANATATAPRPRQASYVPRGPTLTSLAGMKLGACVIAALVGVVCATTPAPTRTLAVRGDEDKLPAGGLTITEPAQTAQASYYKIAPHETITFGWNFTSLKATPTRLYVVASCSKNGNTYPIAPSPQGIPGDATSVTWYPYGYHIDAQKNGDPDLVVDKYRLMIYDEKGPGGLANGGEFQPNNMAEFSMYFPMKYTPLSGTCALG